MDRTYWYELGQFAAGEKVVSQQPGVRLYDGEDRVSHVWFLIPNNAHFIFGLCVMCFLLLCVCRRHLKVVVFS